MRTRTRGLLAWAAFALVLIAAPLLFRSSLALSMLSQMGYLAIICLSYNILLGQGGMLSFGHALYTGMGAFIAVHAMKLAAAGGAPVPLVAVPLVAGLAGAGCAALFGYVTTRKSGTPFAMITLGLGELVAALALMFPGFFGGEAGVSVDRGYGRLLGWSFGPPLQAYALIAAYCFACTALMYAFTLTPLGRLLNAVRDNAERVAFIGHDPRWVRYLAFVAAGFFAGIGGGLAAIHFEIVNAADSLSAARSASYLLFTFLGGAGFFFGPVIGAVLLVLASVLLSAYTKAWLLYLGLAFVGMVMFAPGGVASLLVALAQWLRSGRWRPAWRPAVALAGAGAVLAAGTVLLVELLYHRQLDAALGPRMVIAGVQLDTASAAPWAIALGLCAVGGLLLAWLRSRLAGAGQTDAAGAPP